MVSHVLLNGRLHECARNSGIDGVPAIPHYVEHCLGDDRVLAGCHRLSAAGRLLRPDPAPGPVDGYLCRGYLLSGMAALSGLRTGRNGGCGPVSCRDGAS